MAGAGVWGISPYGNDIFSETLNMAKGLGGLTQLGINNQAGRLALDKTRATQPNEIEALNSKYQTDARLYPELQQADLGYKNALTNEARARAILYGRQGEKENPLATYEALYNAWANEPEGSPKKYLYADLLNGIAGGAKMGGLNALGASRGGASGGAGLAPGGAGDISLNPLGGSNRAGFHQGVIQNPDGSISTIESPTTQSASASQLRDVSEAEMDALYDKVTPLMAPYKGAEGYKDFFIDTILARLGNKKAIEKVQKYNLGSRFLSELASINARQSTGGNPGIELVNEYKKANFPGILDQSFIGALTPTGISELNDILYRPLQKQAIDEGIKREREGFVRDGQPPLWAQDQGARGMFTGMGYQPPRAPEPRAAIAPKPQVDELQLVDMAQKAIEAGADPKAVAERIKQLRAARAR